MYSEEQKSQHIYDLQTCLRRLQQERGVSPLVPDGIYGAETAEAVRAHQRECGLPVTGRVDRETWDSIYAAAAQLFAADTPPAAVLFFPRSGVLAPGSRGRAVFVLQLIHCRAALREHRARSPHGRVRPGDRRRRASDAGRVYPAADRRDRPRDMGRPRSSPQRTFHAHAARMDDIEAAACR